MSTTELGKELRRLRIDQDERLFDMAIRLGLSSAFISNIESGRKSPPVGFEEQIINCYHLNAEQAVGLRISADRSRKAFKLEANSQLQRDTAGLMARRMDLLSPNELSSILSILKKNSERQG